jgi:hypothetical protein
MRNNLLILLGGSPSLYGIPSGSGGGCGCIRSTGIFTLAFRQVGGGAGSGGSGSRPYFSFRFAYRVLSRHLDRLRTVSFRNDWVGGGGGSGGFRPDDFFRSLGSFAAPGGWLDRLPIVSLNFLLNQSFNLTSYASTSNFARN